MRYYRGIRFDLESDLKNKVVYARREIEDAKLAMRDAIDKAKAIGNPEVARLLKDAGEKALQARLLLIQAEMKFK